MNTLMIVFLSLPLIAFVALAALVYFVVTSIARNNRETALLSDQETKLLNDLIDSMNKMERRIENLETIIVERERKSEFERL